MNRWIVSKRVPFVVLACCAVSMVSGAAWADDVCGGKEEQQQTARLRASATKAEQSGDKAAQIAAYRALVSDDCAPKDVLAQAKSRVPTLARELATEAEAKGQFYAHGKASAFLWFETAGAFADADRVMLKAVRAKPDDIETFRAAMKVDTLSERQAGAKPHTVDAAYRAELEKTATATVARLLAQEEKDAARLSGSLMDASMAATQSLTTLERAAQWMAFLPGGDAAAKARAEQRGDAILKRSDAALSSQLAVPYYKFAGSAKAAQVKQQADERAKVMQKKGEQLKDAVEKSVTEKSQADQSKFKKGQADLEKELGF
ncbi:MAG: hypothetical protein U0172_12270 [Nitrospiraceae bacterium]